MGLILISVADSLRTDFKNAKSENTPGTLALSGFTKFRKGDSMKLSYTRKINFGRIIEGLKKILKLAMLILELLKKLKDF